MFTGKPLSHPGKPFPPTPGRGTGSRKSLSRGSPARGQKGPLGPPPTPGKPARKPIVSKAPLSKRTGEQGGQGFITNFFTSLPSTSLEASPPEDSPDLTHNPSVCSDGFRMFTAAHPPRLSQCNESASQGGGFSVLSSQSQDWLVGGTNFDLGKASVSPPRTAQKKRRSALFDDDNAVDSLSHNIHAVRFNSPGVLTRNQSKSGVPGTMTLEGVSVNKFWLGVESVTHDRELNEMNAKRKRQREIVPADVTSRFLLEFAKVADVGKGSFCTVSQAKHRLDGCTYAVKKYIRELGTEQQRLRALSEVHALSALVDCRTVLRYYCSWFEGSVLYVQTEMCWGSLEQLVCGSQASHTTLSQSAHRDITDRVSGGFGGEVDAMDGSRSDSDDENAPSLLRCNAATPSHVPVSHPGSFSAQKAGLGSQNRRSSRAVLSPQSPGRFEACDDSGDVAEPSSPVAHNGPLRRPLLKPASQSLDDDIGICTPMSQPAVESPCLTAASPESFNGKFCSQRGVAASAVLPSNARHWLNEPLLKQCVAEIAEALHDLHSRNMVHLDVKPANILVQFSDRYSGPLSLNSDGNIVRDVESDGVVITFKLGDFGLACSIYEPCPEDGDGSYLSWELMNQCTTPETLPMSDIFSLGVAMYEIARAKPVRHDSSIQETLRSGVAPPIPGVSSEFMDLLQSMVARNPVERLSAAGILAHPALEGVKCIPSHFRELSRAPSSLPSKPSYLQLEARIAALEAQLLEANRRNDALEDTLTQAIA